MEETRVVGLDLAHGELWTYFSEDRIYALTRHLTLVELQRAVAEMTVHARILDVVAV